VGRYRGIGLVTLELAEAAGLSQELKRLIRRSGLLELKWSELRSARSRRAASQVLDCLMARALERVVRLDVLMWDVEDSRHNIPGRDDFKNLRRMYYFLFKNVLVRRWPADTVWKIYVDESTQQPWSDLHYLSEIIEWTTGELVAQLRVEEIVAVKSHREPLIQAADLVSGLAVYSRNSYAKFAGRYGKAEADGPQPSVSNADRERLKLLAHFYEQCRAHKMGVSLNQKRGLRTFNPAQPINFWWYEPQGSYDRAPT
jgi:hypothetical protein